MLVTCKTCRGAKVVMNPLMLSYSTCKACSGSGKQISENKEEKYIDYHSLKKARDIIMSAPIEDPIYIPSFDSPENSLNACSEPHIESEEEKVESVSKPQKRKYNKKSKNS